MREVQELQALETEGSWRGRGVLWGDGLRKWIIIIIVLIERDSLT